MLARGPVLLRLARPRDQRGGRGRGHEPDADEVRARLRAQPRAAAPDRDRPRVEAAARHGRRLPGRGRRLHRRRQQLRGLRLPVPRRQADRQGQEAAGRGDRAGGCAEPDARRLRLRLRRHQHDDAAREDVHPRPRLHAGADPRRRPALPRHGEQHLRALPPQADRGARGAAARHLRGRRPLRAGRGHRAGAGGGARRPRRHRRGDPVPGGRARPRRSPSTSAATATSTWPRTSGTSPASSSTTSCRRRRSTGRSRSCRRSRTATALRGHRQRPCLRLGASPPSPTTTGWR